MYVDKSQLAQDVDKSLSKKILQHLHIFFKNKPNNPNSYKVLNKTKRNRSIHNKTLKLIN